MTSQTARAIEHLRSALSHLPTAAMDLESIRNQGIDPSEFARALPLINAIRRIQEYLVRFENEVSFAKLSDAPKHHDLEIARDIEWISNLVHQIREKIEVQKGSTQKGRYAESSVRGLIDQVEDKYRDIFKYMQYFEPGEAGDIPQVNPLQEQLNRESKELVAKLQETYKASLAAKIADDNLRTLRDTIEEHRKQADKWLAWLIRCLLATVLMLLALTFMMGRVDTTEQIIAAQISAAATGQNTPVFTDFSIAHAITQIVSKLVLVSFALGCCVICSRNYQAHIHNVIVNKQREVAWESFKDLYNSIEAGDQTAKQQLVMEAAQAIFAHGSTGFLSKGANEFAALASVVGEVVNKAK
ncbi:hypothetical protein [Roseimicrobium sp. ORNL1]|uniref:hypothetical protein n=1 Tax=Roseimicrobium sp. ORNL1 TaxID=2711231 RepID=UPI0013E122CB|nr:hypothetical protein [Roseimicrobium sp. ORNL1]QIF03836.1 hypothetical protein G5S37_20685 [Roseimicrobium sp. ORNL1]